MNAALVCALASWFGLMFMPLRLMVVMGLWISVLHHSEFFNSLGQVALKKTREIDTGLLIQQAEEVLVKNKLRASKFCRAIISTSSGIYEVLSPIFSRLILMTLYIATVINIYII